MTANMLFNRYFVAFCCFLISFADSNFRHTGGLVNCSPIKSTIEQLSMKNLCYRRIVMDKVKAAVSLHPSDNPLEPLAQCMKCPVTIETPEHHFRFSVLVYSLDTEISGTHECVKNRLDIFNGRKNSKLNLISGPRGVCGRSPPGKTYITSGNSVTIQLSTECAKHHLPKQTASFNIVVSKLNNNDTNACPGQFQCDNGLACIDKDHVCDDVSNCLDQSDERDCPTKKFNLPHWMVALVIIAIIGILAFVIFVLIYAIHYCIKTCWKGYSKV